MLVDEYDDEKTLDEEEALESDASDDELNTLQKEGEMPLEDLLAMFGYKDGERVGGEPESEEEEEESDEEEEEDGDVAEEVPESSAPKVAADKPATEAPNKEPVPMLAPKEVPPCAAVPTLAPPPSVESKVATTTKTPSPVTRATPTPPHPPPRREHRTTSTAHLLRSVSHASESSNSDSDEDFTLEEYWKKTIQVGSEYQATIPVGLCKYDDAPEMSLWSEEECRSFESGLRLYGKDFHLIQLHKVRTRSVGELVHFYYLWKKTERHDIFASKVRLEKKKYALHPGTTDYMDRFLDEQENSQQQQQQSQQQPRDRSTSPSEAKRPRLALPMQLTSQLVGPQENGRETSATASLTVATDPTRPEQDGSHQSGQHSVCNTASCRGNRTASHRCSRRVMWQQPLVSTCRISLLLRRRIHPSITR
ncbi:hypothetical protein HPB49_014924 [Dermacentor silvarum]|uniref:Uncharacterized protein n=1 Tax=Dermacentor silvarum TaxID=543639 RepID=A0ACB8DJI2_DERSI|nr:hypothetical protein HPB49_014924 [Dermacentor silvarum]